MTIGKGKPFDYIIVGAGAAGSVLANRLSSDPDVSVLLIEAGGSDRNPLHLVPKGFYFTLNNPRYAKNFDTETYGDNVKESWKRGRVLGGSTTINGMVWNRGWAEDYDAWEKAGNHGWNWKSFLGAYKKIEKHELGESDVRGGSGAVAISVAGPREQACDALIASMNEAGVPFVDDMNGTGDERVGYVASNIAKGLRASAARAYVRPARRRKNLTIFTRTEVDRVVFRGTRAVGVTGTRKGKRVDFSARREVLVCGGAFDSPLLLERSGIGDPEVLAAAGVETRVPSPRVGENLREHRGILLQYRLTGVKGYNAEAVNFPTQMWTGFKYLFTRSGVIAHGGYTVAAMYKSDPAADRPDTQAFFTPISTSDVNPMTGRMVVDKTPGAKYVTFPLYPTSSGSIHITGPDATDPPRLTPNFLDTEHDRQLIPKVIRRAREIVAAQPFAKYVSEELDPGPELVDDEELVKYALDKGVSGYHTLGTCAIGPDDTDVVDNRLRVRGTEGLRVVDASVFPQMPSGNNNAPTMALAWIAADLIQADNTNR
jgi:choline dehydrogenase